jgi:hypothetical protein
MDKIVKPILCESLIGVYTASVGKGTVDVEVYKNPTTISHMRKWCRAITDLKGNLYVADNPGMLHGDIYKFLCNKGELYGGYFNTYKTEWGYKNSVAWQRYDGTNKFYLSESYYSDILSNNEDNSWKKEYWPKIVEWGKHVKDTPHIKYIWQKVPPNFSYFSNDDY